MGNIIINLIQGIAIPTIGSFGGAYFAFKLLKNKEKHQENKQYFEEGKHAQFILATHLHVLTNFGKQFLDPERKNIKRHQNLKRVNVLLNCPPLEFKKISYMLDNTDPDILIDLFVHERKFLDFVDSTKSRNDSYDQACYNPSLIDSLLKESTDSLYTSHENSLKSTKIVLERLTSYLKKKFPNFYSQIEILSE